MQDVKGEIGGPPAFAPKGVLIGAGFFSLSFQPSGGARVWDNLSEAHFLT